MHLHLIHSFNKFAWLICTVRDFILGAGESERGGGSYNYGQEGSNDSYGGSYGGSYGAGGADSYGRGSGNIYSGSRGGDDAYGGSRGRYGGYAAAGDDENYPSNYQVIPMPGAPQNCKGSGCCVPKCFAEKGSRVSFRG